MRALTKLSYPFAILAAFALAPAPAHAQFEGAGDQMAQFAPMMEQFAPMMEQVAPMMLSMMAPGGSMPGMENITGMMGDGATRRAGRRHR